MGAATEIPGLRNGRVDNQQHDEHTITHSVNIDYIDTHNTIHNMIKAKLGKLFVKCLIDTGASITVIRKDIYQSSGIAKWHKLETPDINYIKGVSGSKIKVLGQIHPTINIGKMHLVQKFYILENMLHPIILGADFLQDQKAIISYESNLLLI